MCGAQQRQNTLRWRSACVAPHESRRGALCCNAPPCSARCDGGGRQGRGGVPCQPAQGAGILPAHLHLPGRHQASAPPNLQACTGSRLSHPHLARSPPARPPPPPPILLQSCDSDDPCSRSARVCRAGLNRTAVGGRAGGPSGHVHGARPTGGAAHAAHVRGRGARAAGPRTSGVSCARPLLR